VYRDSTFPLFVKVILERFEKKKDSLSGAYPWEDCMLDCPKIRQFIYIT